MVYKQTRLCPKKWDPRNTQGFWDTNRSRNPCQKIRPNVNYLNKEKRKIKRNSVWFNKKQTFYSGNFVVPVDFWMKIKESKNIDKYLDLVRELKKRWNMKVSVIPIVIGVFALVPKCLEIKEKEVSGRIATIHATALSRRVR